MPKNFSRTTISFWAKFLLFCAGANTNQIYKTECERDRSKYVSIGATILITAVMAGLSGGYALFTVFQSYAISAGLGGFWGLTIFNLDRSFTSTTKKTKNNKNWGKQTVATGIRLFLATLVGLVIAKPFEVKIFESKINETIARETVLKDKQTRNLSVEAVQIDSLKDQVKELRNKQEDTQEQWLKWEDLANKEAEGIAGTGLRGKGIVYKEKKETATQLKQQLEDLRKNIRSKEEEISRLENQQDNILQVIKEQTKISLVDQVATLHKLAKEEDIILWSSLGISLLLIAVEISPLLVKILAPYGTYDALIEAEEENFINIQEQKIVSLKESIATEIRIHNSIRDKTANFIDKQYLQVLEKALIHEKVEEVREQIILNVAKIVEKQLSQRTKDISELGLEINSSINEIINQVTREKFQQEANFIATKNKINDLFNDLEAFENEVKV